MRLRQLSSLIAFLVTSWIGSLSAQVRIPRLKEEHPGLAVQATISADSAWRVARAAVPNGLVAAREVEVEDGRLRYSFDMRIPGKPGIEEVGVDVRTGALIAVEHECEG